MAEGSSLALGGGTKDGCAEVGGGGGGGGKEPNCIERKYFVAACRSCSLSSAVWRLEDQLIAC